MCSHYDPLLNVSRLSQYFGVDDFQLTLDQKPSLWPGYFGPFVRRHEHADVGDEAVPDRELLRGSFGLIPHWAKDTKIARQTYNARSETVADKNSFRDAWKYAKHCIIPAEAFFEPDWRSGKAIPTRIKRVDGAPCGIAGLWDSNKIITPGQTIYSFTMLTINADDHPFMKKYHQVDNEKRMIVVLRDEDYETWLNASPEDSKYFLKQFPADQLIVDTNTTTA